MFILSMYLKLFYALDYLHCFEQYLRVEKAHPYSHLQFVSCVLAFSSGRVFRPAADLECLVPDSSTLAREQNCFAKCTLIKLKQYILSCLFFILHYT